MCISTSAPFYVKSPFCSLKVIDLHHQSVSKTKNRNCHIKITCILEKLQLSPSPSNLSTAYYHLSDTLPQRSESVTKQVFTDRHAHKHKRFIQLSAVSVTVSSFPPPPHTHGSGKKWEDRGSRNRWVQASAENPESDTNGPKERQRGTAPSGLDTTQPASSKTQI